VRIRILLGMRMRDFTDFLLRRPRGPEATLWLSSFSHTIPKQGDVGPHCVGLHIEVREGNCSAGLTWFLRPEEALDAAHHLKVSAETAIEQRDGKKLLPEEEFL
jgi:hypothetical protein